MTTPMRTEELRGRSYSLPAVPEWEKDTHWGKYRLAMRDHFAANDTSEMLMWSTVSATMFVGEFHITLDEVKELQATPRWIDYAEGALVEDSFGSPPRMAELAGTSGNLIHQTHHLWQWERITGEKIEEQDVIVEFGGGYGAMCAIARRMGFEGRYYLVDYPEMTLLQEFYLSNLGFDATYIPSDFGTDFRDYIPYNTDLLIAIHSLSESPVPQRDNFMSSIVPTSWLISYQPRFYNVDNSAWIDTLIDKRKGYDHTLVGNKVNTNIQYLVSSMKGINVQN